MVITRSELLCKVMASRAQLLVAQLLSLPGSPVGPSPLCSLAKDAGQMSRSCIPFHEDEKEGSSGLRGEVQQRAGQFVVFKTAQK